MKSEPISQKEEEIFLYLRIRKRALGLISRPLFCVASTIDRSTYLGKQLLLQPPPLLCSIRDRKQRQRVAEQAAEAIVVQAQLEFALRCKNRYDGSLMRSCGSDRSFVHRLLHEIAKFGQIITIIR